MPGPYYTNRAIQNALLIVNAAYEATADGNDWGEAVRIALAGDGMMSDELAAAMNSVPDGFIRAALRGGLLLCRANDGCLYSQWLG